MLAVIAAQIVSLILLGILLELFIRDIAGLKKGRAPFVPSTSWAAKELRKIVALDQRSVVYDLGCGDGRLLTILHDRYPEASYVGIENTWLPYFLARLRTRRFQKTMRIMHGDIFRADIRNATHVLLYLFPEVTDRLLPKLEQELRPGSLVYALDFGFANRKADTVIAPDPKRRGGTIYVYRF